MAVKNFSLSPEVIEHIQAEADRAGLTHSAYVGKLVREDALGAAAARLREWEDANTPEAAAAHTWLADVAA